jgi:hypothetical protein
VTGIDLRSNGTTKTILNVPGTLLSSLLGKVPVFLIKGMVFSEVQIPTSTY